MRFEEVVDFPGEREAYMIVREILGLSEEEYLKLSWIERRELSLAYRIAKKLGMEYQEELHSHYKNTDMFDENGVYNLAGATMIIKAKAGILSLARTKLGVKDSIEEFILKGDTATNKIAVDVKKVVGNNIEELTEHMRPLLVFSVDEEIEEEKIVNNRFEFEK